jgi:uncharacterized protein (TIGR02145 family)
MNIIKTKFILITLIGLLALTVFVVQSCKKDENANQSPIAGYTASPTSGIPPLTVNFSDQSVNNPTNWQWDFGDGGTSTKQNPVHTYNIDGFYAISLTINNEFGSDTKTKTNYINVGSGDGGEPCSGLPTVTDADGNVYNTVQIGGQCWMKENLRVGTQIDGSQEMTNDSMIEKYCHLNNPANCEIHGGLYQWNEMMQYNATPGVQGICPPGWHIPTDDEWKILEGTVDSQYPVGNSIWDDYNGRGYDAGKNLKSATGWYQNTGNDLFGFLALPGGYRHLDGIFDSLISNGVWWSSTENGSGFAWYRYLYTDYDKIFRSSYNKCYGLSIRCLRN